MTDTSQANLAAAITQALAYTENGGAPTTPVAGKSGELKSIFQFLPSTWKQYVSDAGLPADTPLTTENEYKVVGSKVLSWLNQGFTPAQIGSMWNAGSGEPDAYKGTFTTSTSTHKAGDPSTGVNSSKVAFDVPGYAKKVTDYTNQFLSVLEPDKNPIQKGIDAVGGFINDNVVNPIKDTVSGIGNIVAGAGTLAGVGGAIIGNNANVAQTPPVVPSQTHASNENEMKLLQSADTPQTVTNQTSPATKSPETSSTNYGVNPLTASGADRSNDAGLMAVIDTIKSNQLETSKEPVKDTKMPVADVISALSTIHAGQVQSPPQGKIGGLIGKAIQAKKAPTKGRGK